MAPKRRPSTSDITLQVDDEQEDYLSQTPRTPCAWMTPALHRKPCCSVTSQEDSEAFEAPMCKEAIKQIVDDSMGSTYFLDTLDCGKIPKEKALELRKSSAQLRSAVKAMANQLLLFVKERDVAQEVIKLSMERIREELEEDRKCRKEEMRVFQRTIEDRIDAKLEAISASSSMPVVDHDAVKLMQQNAKENLSSIADAVTHDVCAQVTTAIQKSYASTVHGEWRTQTRKKTIKTAQGPVIEVDGEKEIVVVPTQEGLKKYKDAEEVRLTIRRCINPVIMGLRVNRLLLKGRGVIIGVENEDIENIIRSPIWKRNMLEARRGKVNSPRLEVFNVESDLTIDDLKDSVAKFYLAPDMDPDITLVHRKKQRNGRFTWIIESTPEICEILRNSGRVRVGWYSYKVVDHIAITQCFNCQDFGHIAKHCAAETICGKCSGQHETRTCRSQALACINCKEAKMADWKHSALDATKCSVLCSEITRKARTVTY